jgi:hypothetical protein
MAGTTFPTSRSRGHVCKPAHHDWMPSGTCATCGAEREGGKVMETTATESMRPSRCWHEPACETNERLDAQRYRVGELHVSAPLETSDREMLSHRDVDSDALMPGHAIGDACDLGA